MSVNPSTAEVQSAPGPSRAALAERFSRVRTRSTALAEPLSAEDQCVQSMPDASPTKWHLAHTSWFFEAVVLAQRVPGYEPFEPRWNHLFNSYYESLGPRHPRPQRGLLTRPLLASVHRYRAHVETAVEQFIANADDSAWEAVQPLVELGLQHEEQHQGILDADQQLPDRAHELHQIGPRTGFACQLTQNCRHCERSEAPRFLALAGLLRRFAPRNDGFDGSSV